jgi:YidC/Oxa1 family membrane protein insertase
MEKRLILAMALMAAAIMLTNYFFPPPEPVAEMASDSVVASPPAALLPQLPQVGVTTPQAMTEDSIIVESALYRHVFSTRGGALLRGELLGFPSYSVPGGNVQLVPPETREFLTHRLVVGLDTVDLRTVSFVPSERRVQVTDSPASFDLQYVSEGGFGLVLRYRFDPASYLFTVEGQVSGLGGRSGVLLTSLSPGLDDHEHPDHRSERELAVVSRSPSGIQRTAFGRVEARSLAEGELTWAGVKDKYFLAAVVAGDRAPLRGALVGPAPPTRRVVDGSEITVPRVQLAPAVPVGPDGTLGFDVYLGPQEYGRLSAIGFDLQEVTPYGYRWLQPIIRPLAAAVMWVLNTLHDSLGIAYGWVLVIFGVMMRIVLWPLNAKAMRAQMRNMAVQPLLQEIKEKHGNDPQKQQEAMLSLYKEHGFNPLAGCLPLLVPFPVLITLFFVFQNTIAFRGANFLWLPDLSLRDPLYILPIILVVSMFMLQWVMAKMSGIEQNPQMKMMMYFLPVMMGVIFFMLPAGLNLYYAVTQVASIPQQVLIARERRRAQDELKAAPPPKLSVGQGPKKGAKKSKR